MFEITKETDSFDELKYTGSIPTDAKYDFTFEHRFLVYHYPALHQLLYIAYDLKTGLGSEIFRRKTVYKSTDYGSMIKHLLFSIKYTGDYRYLNRFRTDPMKVIESVFRVILPSYGYAVREEQIRLCKNMYKGLTEKSVAICEAEVGTGKTMAYLVAALVAKKNNTRREEPVTITTSNIELQKSIVEREIPNLSRMLMDYGLIDRPLTSFLRKGKEHYFCRMRFKEFVNDIHMQTDRYGKLLKAFEECNFATQAFDLDKVRISASIKKRICVRGTCSCCKLMDECRYAMYKKAAVSTDSFDFQVTNHNLFLADRKLNNITPLKRLLRPSAYVIIDEAHKFHEAAQAIFGAQINESTVNRFLIAVKFLCGKKTENKAYRSLLQNAFDLNKLLFDYLRQTALETHTDEEGIHLITVAGEMAVILEKLYAILKEIEHCRKKRTGQNDIDSNSLLSTVSAFCRQSNMNNWTEVDENGKITLCCASKNIGNKLYNKVWNMACSYVMTSGTLNDGNGFSYFKRENGINNIPSHLILETHTDSPFDYKHHTRLYMPYGIPSPTESDTEEYIDAISENISGIIDATNGHTAILFTSYRTLNAVYDKLKDRLAGYDVIRMTRGNKNAISDFKASKNGVLFASGSMWEGVDVAGDKLSSVIIVRLPFPMASSFSEMKREDCKDIHEFVKSYAIPEMVIKLRQGIGRLIRSEIDTGLVSILDSRATNRYAKIVDSVVYRYPRARTLDEIKCFFHETKNPDYYS